MGRQPAKPGAFGWGCIIHAPSITRTGGCRKRPLAGCAVLPVSALYFARRRLALMPGGIPAIPCPDPRARPCQRFPI